MTITDLFITSNRELLRVVEQIKPEHYERSQNYLRANLKL